jgi:hypothetical protein
MRMTAVGAKRTSAQDDLAARMLAQAFQHLVRASMRKGEGRSCDPSCAQTFADDFGRSHSLFLPRNSLFLEIVSLLICVGNCAKNRCGTVAYCHEIGRASPKIARFPVKFPVTREFAWRRVRSPLRRQPASAALGYLTLRVVLTGMPQAQRTQRRATSAHRPLIVSDRSERMYTRHGKNCRTVRTVIALARHLVLITVNRPNTLQQ